MLKIIKVKSLFGLYSYELNLENTEASLIKFITGPNGYGKTTILEFIYSLYKGNLKMFSDIPFERLDFVFDNETVSIEQKKEYREQENSDEKEQTVTLCIELRKLTDNHLIQRYEANGSDIEDGMELGLFSRTLDLYFKAQPVYFIKDQRLWQTRGAEKNESNVRSNADHLKKILEEEELNFGWVYNRKFSEYSKELVGISEELYNTGKGDIETVLGVLKSYGIQLPVTLPEYQQEMAIYQGTMLKALKDTISERQDFINRVNALSEIITRSQFAHKLFQIDKRYGYRFVVDDELNTILNLDALSSGEKHILLQTYELLFGAEDGALVLIDEPEMSFHLMWQVDYLKNIESISKLRNLQCVICTHSPQIFNRNWDLTIDLYEQAQVAQKKSV